MRRPLCMLALILTAALRIMLCFMQYDEDPYQALDGELVTLQGHVTAKEYKKGTNTWTGEETLTLLVTMDHVEMAGNAMNRQDKVLIRIPVESAENPEDQTAQIGMRVRVRGTLSVFEPATNHGGFNARLYYRTLGVAFQIRNAALLDASGKCDPLGNTLYLVRKRFHDVLNQCCVSREDADILAAMLLGDKGTLSQEIRDLYQSAGIIHILAISGLHIEIIGMGLYRFLSGRNVPRGWRAIFAGGVMLLYGGMTGVSASSLRALMMFALHILARTIHRTYDLLSALSVAGILILLEQPLYLFHAGFLFSFGAVLSIGLLTPILPANILPAAGRGVLWRGEQRLRDRIRMNAGRPSMTLPSISLQGLSATIGTFPVNLYSYGTFPIYSVALNAMVLPLMSLVMVSGLVTLGTGMVFPVLGRLAAWPVHYLLHFYRQLCRIAARLPGHIQVLGHPETGTLYAFLFLMGLLVLCAEGIPLMTWRQRRAPTGVRHAQAALPGVVVLLWITGCLRLLLWHNEAGLRIHVVDVGQGDGIYIECDGSRILIDGGSTDRSAVSQYELEPLLAWYGADAIDLAVMTHEDQDHMNGLLTLLTSQTETGIRIRRLALPDTAVTTRGDNYLAIERAAREMGTQILYLHQGDEIRIGDLLLTCLHPGAETAHRESNETSVTLYLQYGRFTGFFTGDLEGAGEEECLSYMASRTDLFPLAGDGNAATHDRVTFLKVAHHGSRGATTEAFLDAVAPQYAVISCGENNRYGHPHTQTLERLAAAGAEILDTRRCGEITISTNGRTMRMEQFLPGSST